jgi:hypothetical protein
MDALPALDVSLPRCPVHPGEAAPLTCTRCGRFLCEGCNAGGAAVRCTACQTTETDPFGLRAHPPSIPAFLEGGKALLAATARVVVPLWAVVFSVENLALLLVAEQTGDTMASIYVSGILGFFFRAWGTGASLSALLGAAEGAPLSLGQACRAGLSSMGRMISTLIRVNLNILAYALLLVVPGVMRAATLSVSLAAAADRHYTDPLRISEERTRGRRMPVGLVLVTAYVACFLIDWVLNMVGSGISTAVPVAGSLLPALLSAYPVAFFDALTVAVYVSLGGPVAAPQSPPAAAP